MLAACPDLLTTLPLISFVGELKDREGIIWLVEFDKQKQQELKSFRDYNIPITLYDCRIQQNKDKIRIL